MRIRARDDATWAFIHGVINNAASGRRRARSALPTSATGRAGQSSARRFSAITYDVEYSYGRVHSLPGCAGGGRTPAKLTQHKRSFPFKFGFRISGFGFQLTPP